VPLEVARELLDRAESAERDVVRLQADLANVRRHRDEAVARARVEARAESLGVAADVADDLRRALEVAPDGPWRSGLERLLDRVRHRLEGAGARELGAPGERFDPSVHEAIGTADGVPGTVVGVAETGLSLDDGTLLRPARVVVAR
jgi:molecular chaperone GrpE